MQFTAYKYKGNEWGVFASRSKCYVVFGTKAKMVALAERLNKIDALLN